MTTMVSVYLTSGDGDRAQVRAPRASSPRSRWRGGDGAVEIAILDFAYDPAEVEVRRARL
jgi:hypothetical protein